jgi:glyoxylase-like metal-dependent hydrolase (beta-lactamase superfamily II)
VLGQKAEVYGEPAPVPASTLAEFAEIEDRGLTVLDTPGHAPHHLAFVHGDRIFLGECAGTFSTMGRGPRHEEYYLRPATPPRFDLETAVASLERVLALDPFPRRLLFAHHGEFCGDTRRLLTTARDQLRLWTETVREFRAGLAALPHTEQPDGEDALMSELRAALHRVDVHYARSGELPPDIQERERDFTRQTLRGILAYLKET